MRVIKKEKIIRKAEGEQVMSVCNKCGSNIDIDEILMIYIGDKRGNREFATWGGLNSIFGDVLHYHLCDNCIMHFVEDFEIPPRKYVL